MPKTETLLFTIDKKNECRIGLPPAAPGDSYHKRAKFLGKLENASHVFFNPKGQMFVVRGDELFKGPTPNTPWGDWFSLAKCVGRGIWDQCRLLYFSPSGKLFAVTKSGAWYRGPEPENEHVPWVYKKSSKIGGSGWEAFNTLFFDPDGIMYGLYEGKLRRNRPLSTTDGRWLEQSFIVGEDNWNKLSYFMGFSSDGKLWCVSHDDGVMYTADPPTEKNVSWKQKARNMGGDFRLYKSMSFTEDKTIKKVVSLDFLVDLGKILSMEPELVTEKVYDNKDSTTPLKSTFEVSKTYINESEFTHEHGLEFGLEAETTFEAGIPFVGKSETRLSMSATTSHNWSFVERNRTETVFKMVSEFEVEPGNAVRQTAVAKKAKIDVPYTAVVETVFGNRTTISGTWKGSSMFDLKIRQTDEK